MTTAGARIKNMSGGVQLDEHYANYSLFYKGAVASKFADGFGILAGTVELPYIETLPGRIPGAPVVVYVRLRSDYYISFGPSMIVLNTAGTAGMGGVAVEFCVFQLRVVHSGPGAKVRVRNAANTLVWDSGRSPLRVTNAVNVHPWQSQTGNIRTINYDAKGPTPWVMVTNDSFFVFGADTSDWFRWQMCLRHGGVGVLHSAAYFQRYWGNYVGEEYGFAPKPNYVDFGGAVATIMPLSEVEYYL